MAKPKRANIGPYHYAVAYNIDEESHKDNKLKHYVRGVNFVVSNPNKNGTQFRTHDFKAKKNGDFYSKCFNLVKKDKEGNYIPNLEIMEYENLSGYKPYMSKQQVALLAVKRNKKIGRELGSLRKEKRNMTKIDKPKKREVVDDDEPYIPANDDFNEPPRKEKVNEEEREKEIERRLEAEDNDTIAVLLNALSSPEDLDSLQKYQYVTSNVIDWQVLKLRKTCPRNMYIFTSHVGKSAFEVEGGVKKNHAQYEEVLGSFNELNRKRFKFLVFQFNIDEPSFKHWIIYIYNTDKKTLKIIDPLWNGKKNPVQRYKKYSTAMMKLLRANKFTINNNNLGYYKDIPQQHDSWSCGLFCIMNLRCISNNNFRFDYTREELDKMRVSLLTEIGGQDKMYVDIENQRNKIKDASYVSDDPDDGEDLISGSQTKAKKEKKPKDKNDVFNSLYKGELVSELTVDYYINHFFNKNKEQDKFAFNTKVIKEIRKQKEDNKQIFAKRFKGDRYKCKRFLIPIKVKDDHWIVYMYNKLHGTINIFDSNFAKTDKKVYDKYTKAIKKFFGDVDGKDITVVVNRTDIPQQKDSTSSGRHMMMNMDCILRNAQNKYTDKMLNDFIAYLRNNAISTAKRNK